MILIGFKKQFKPIKIQALLGSKRPFGEDLTKYYTGILTTDSIKETIRCLREALADTSGKRT